MESVERLMVDMNFYKDKRVLITGHTGFKGSWLCKILINAGAKITGYSLDTPTNPSLYELANIEDKITNIIGDIRNLNDLQNAFEQSKPEIVFHLAAQPLVIESYHNPVYTYETNVIGTVNILECIRKSDTVKSFVNITTDKVYQNNEWEWGYRETDILNGFDPYSNSKSCSELVTDSYKKSFFSDNRVKISTVRAGNVIGGGDFAENRIIPDCIKAAIKGENIQVRNPKSIRPYQHVLEPLFAYLLIAEKQYKDEKFCGCYNIGPEYSDCIETGKLVSTFCDKWGENINWESKQLNNQVHEAKFLKLDCSKIKNTFGWKPKWNIEKAIEKTVEFAKIYKKNEDISKIMDKQIKEYMEENKNVY